jgi:flavin reductase (DIM6/NTAB) family NADH-FMN oxidoreductase RutF
MRALSRRISAILVRIPIVGRFKMTHHQEISPAILYWGTPVVLISSTNPDSTTNIGPMSSAWWLGHGCMLGLDASSQTTQNMLRTKQCVLNLASDDMAASVNAIARTTGTNPVPEGKVERGYEFVKDKFATAGLTPMASKKVQPRGIKECPVVMEAEVVAVHEMYGGRVVQGLIVAIEVRIVRVSIHQELRLEGYRNRVDAEKWKPMIMMFCDLFGLKNGKLEHSKLADVEEELYRGLTETAGEVENQGSVEIAEHVVGLTASQQ